MDADFADVLRGNLELVCRFFGVRDSYVGQPFLTLGSKTLSSRGRTVAPPCLPTHHVQKNRDPGAARVHLIPSLHWCENLSFRRSPSASCFGSGFRHVGPRSSRARLSSTPHWLSTELEPQSRSHKTMGIHIVTNSPNKLTIPTSTNITHSTERFSPPSTL